METTTIRSVDGDGELRFTNRSGDYFDVEFESATLSVKSRVWSYTDCNLLVDLFISIAEDWKGWSGSKEWKLIESDLSITAKAPSLGGKELCIQIDETSKERPMSARFYVLVADNDLEKVAKNVEHLFGQ